MPWRLFFVPFVFQRWLCGGQWVKGRGVANSNGVSVYFPDRATSVSAAISPLYGNLNFAKKLKWGRVSHRMAQSLRRGGRR
jgi:hypothetical protein